VHQRVPLVREDSQSFVYHRYSDLKLHANSNDAVATVVAAVTLLILVTAVQHCNAPIRTRLENLLFLSWFFLPSVASVPCLRGTHRTAAADTVASRERPVAGLGHEVM